MEATCTGPFSDARDCPIHRPENRPVLSETHAQAVEQSDRDTKGIKYGTLGVPLARRREPTPKDFADPRFDVLWELMKRVDVQDERGLFSGATGNDVCAVLDALDAGTSGAT
jgi:hypothetical protein